MQRGCLVLPLIWGQVGGFPEPQTNPRHLVLVHLLHPMPFPLPYQLRVQSTNWTPLLDLSAHQCAKDKRCGVEMFTGKETLVSPKCPPLPRPLRGGSRLHLLLSL